MLLRWYSFGREFTWLGGIVLLLFLTIIGLNKLSNNRIAGYLYADISDNLNYTIITIHLVVSSIGGILITNRVLPQLTYFEELFAKGQFWIGATIIISVFLLLIIIGFIATSIVKLMDEKKREN